jgi:hypothetical protein
MLEKYKNFEELLGAYVDIEDGEVIYIGWTRNGNHYSMMTEELSESEEEVIVLREKKPTYPSMIIGVFTSTYADEQRLRGMFLNN